MENKPYDAVIGSPSAPYENQLAAACGLATNYHAVTHPSLPNYIAATSGGTQGIADDEPPSAHPLDVASIFSQVKAAGQDVALVPGERAGELPAHVERPVRREARSRRRYYTGIRSDCAAWDVPMGTTSGGNFAHRPRERHAARLRVRHAGPLQRHPRLPRRDRRRLAAVWFAKILASPTYLAGRTVVFLTWDEDDGSAANRVPLIVVSPSTPAGTRSGTSFDHYSLLKTTEQLLGLTTFLGHAGDAGTASMASAFNLG